jgi:acyl-CoA thioester hydrolase
MLLSDFAFRHSFRVRYSEVDAQGVVFNGRYLDYADIAITEYWRAVGFREQFPDEPFEFHVARAIVNFRKPILPDEMLTVAARTTATGRTSLTQMVAIFGPNGDDDFRADAELVNVHVDLATHKSISVPEFLKESFAAYDAKKCSPAL